MTARAPSRAFPSAARATRATAFGLDLRADMPLSFLAGTAARPTGRTVRIALVGDAAQLGWPADAELLSDQRAPDGSVVFRIEGHREAGYLISGPTYGRLRLAADGRRLCCLPDGRGQAEWQRLLVAQALPFAALLHGLEVLHASAVVRGGAAVAFVGPSGAGKTSLALELCARGSGFLADDVLALELALGGRLLAHPGTPVAGVAYEPQPAGQPSSSAQPPSPSEDTPPAARLTVHMGAAREGETIATNARERIVRVAPHAAPAPLGALFFLDRRPDGPPAPRFEPAGDARALLAATFNFVLATPARLRGLLEVCAAVAHLRVERIVLGPRVGVSELAGAIELRLSGPA